MEIGDQEILSAIDEWELQLPEELGKMHVMKTLPIFCNMLTYDSNQEVTTIIRIANLRLT
jgi:hypothetical protein